MNEPIKILQARDIKIKTVLASAIVVALVFGWFAVRWQLGNMLAELTPLSQPNAREIAQLSRSLAPSDPLPVWLAASKEKEDFTPESIDRSLAMTEDVVRLSPDDFRWWIELGRAYEQAERPERAEAAFRRAIELAPSYTFPRWQFGNFFLRQGRTEEAFAELKLATEKSVIYREQVFSLAWDYFDKDPQRVEQLAADTPDVRANLALFYAVRSSSKDSLRMWNTLTDEQKSGHMKTAKVIAQGLHDKRLYRQALEFAKQTGIDPEAEQETVSNGGFEKFIGNAEDTLFGWRVNRTDGRVDITPDPSLKKEGNRSLKIAFKSFNKRDFYNITQIVTAQPSTRYQLTFWVRADNLKSGGPPLVEILNSADDKTIAATQPFATGSYDWQMVTLDFTTAVNSEGFGIRTSLAYCGDECPITGSLWYDDFRLTKQ